MSEPRGEEKYCRDCWDKKIAVEEIVAREFALKRYIRAHSAEKYLIYHSTIKRPCGQLIVVDDGYDLFLTMVLYPNFAWDEPAYHLEGDPEGRSFAEILVDVMATEVIEPWGGGKWHLEIFRTGARRARGVERRDVAPRRQLRGRSGAESCENRSARRAARRETPGSRIIRRRSVCTIPKAQARPNTSQAAVAIQASTRNRPGETNAARIASTHRPMATAIRPPSRTTA